MKHQLLDVWSINNRVNLMVIDELSDEALGAICCSPPNSAASP